MLSAESSLLVKANEADLTPSFGNTHTEEKPDRKVRLLYFTLGRTAMSWSDNAPEPPLIRS
ncbi:MAG: hypothetical protein JNG83_13135 [Opitutaceae bacterium]|nr:hypothetical protein [Opitutaceae bacterium]